MDVNEQLTALGVSLTASLAKNTAAEVADRIRGARTKSKAEDTIAELEQIVNELIEDKAQLTRVAQGYQSELVSQRLTAGDVSYITSKVVPLIESLGAASGTDAAKMTELMGLITPLLSIETVNVLQLLGFNFRRAVGEPLTQLVSSLIESRTQESSAAIQKATLDYRSALVFLARDPEAYARYERLIGSASPQA